MHIFLLWHSAQFCPVLPLHLTYFSCDRLFVGLVSDHEQYVEETTLMSACTQTSKMSAKLAPGT